MPTIDFNGKTYKSIEDMPAAERQAYENTSTNGNGRSTFSMILIGIVLCFAVVAATIAYFVFTNR